MADLLSILSTAPSPNAASAKKVQHEVEYPDGQTAGGVSAPSSTFNPILEQMIAASQGAVTRKETEQNGNDNETVSQPEGIGDKAESIAASFLGGQMMKMTGSPQGHHVNQSVSGDSAKNLGASVSQLIMNGTAEQAISSTGEAGISLARDPVLSPSIVPASSSSESVAPEDVTVQQLLSAKGAALLQNLAALESGQSLTSAEQGVLDAFKKLMAAESVSAAIPVEQGPEGNIVSSQTQVVDGKASGMSQSVKSEIPSFLVAPPANNSTIGTSHLARTSSDPAMTSESKPGAAGEGDAIATELLKLLRNVSGSGENVNGTSARSEQSVSINSPSGEKESGQTTPGTAFNNSASISKTSEELLKLVQRSLGLPVRLSVSRTAGEAAASASNDIVAQRPVGGENSEGIPPGMKNGTVRSNVQLASLESEILGPSLLGNAARKGLNPESTVDATTNVPTEALNDVKQRIEKTVVGQPAGAVNSETKPARSEGNTSIPGKEKASTSSTGEVKPVIASEAVQTPGGKTSGTKQRLTEESERKTESERMPVSTKNSSTQDSVQKAPVDAKIQPAPSTPAGRDQVEFLKSQQLAVHPRIEKQDVPTSAQVKLATLPLEVQGSVQDQVAKEITLKLTDNVSEMKMVLKPESLGEVGISVRMEEGSMVARINVNQSQVRSALEVNLPQLRDALAGKGIQVNRIDITTSSDASSRESNGSSRERSKSSPKRRMDVEGVDAYESTRYLGYNTMEYLI